MATAIIIVIASYLIGSIPMAYILGKFFKGIDIRKAGDGNVGAANAYRQIGPAAGIFVMIFDIMKGVVTVLIAQQFTTQTGVYFAGFTVTVGHIWPVFLNFKGGRGEATAGGVLVALIPAMLILLVIAIMPFAITRNTMILGAILFAPLWLIALVLHSPGSLIAYSIALPCVVGIAHLLTTRHLTPEERRRGKYMRRES